MGCAIFKYANPKLLAWFFTFSFPGLRPFIRGENHLDPCPCIFVTNFMSYSLCMCRCIGYINMTDFELDLCHCHPSLTKYLWSSNKTVSLKGWIFKEVIYLRMNISWTFFSSKLDSPVIKTLERHFTGETNFDEKNVHEKFNWSGVHS